MQLLGVIPRLCRQVAPRSRVQLLRAAQCSFTSEAGGLGSASVVSSPLVISTHTPALHGLQSIPLTLRLHFQAAEERFYPRKMEKSSTQYGSLEKTHVDAETEKSTEDVVSMADSTITIEDIEGELCKIERIRDILVRRESELRYMMDDIQLCKEITRLKTELQKLVSIPDKDKSKEDKEREEELLQQINKLVETRDFLVDDVEFERLREREEDREMAVFLQSKFPKRLAAKGGLKNQKVASKSQQTSAPFITKTGLTLLKDCCGFTCSIM